MNRDVLSVKKVKKHNSKKSKVMCSLRKTLKSICKKAFVKTNSPKTKRITGRMSLFISSFLHRNICGSITLEASILLPLFLFFCISLSSLLVSLRNYGALSVAVWEIGNTLSVQGGYLLPEQIENRIQERMEENWNLSVQASLLDVSHGRTYFCVTYTEQSLFNIWGVEEECFAIAYSGHFWNGYEMEQEHTLEGEPYVYITENGTVYHTTRSCSHLTLSIETVLRSNLETMRNADGGRYYACERCGGGDGMNVYVTGEGNRFHGSISCSGLRRSVRAVPFSEVGVLPACSRCGGAF